MTALAFSNLKESGGLTPVSHFPMKYFPINASA